MIVWLPSPNSSLNQSVKFFLFHPKGIGTAEPAYTLVKVCAG